MSPAICCMCSIGAPPTKNFRLGHCFGPASLPDLLHNPKGTGSSLSLNSPIYGSEKDVLIISFSSEQLSRFMPSQKSSGKNTCFPTTLPCPHVAYPNPCGRPHLRLDDTLWSCSVKLVLRKYAAH